MKLKLTPPETERLKLKLDILLSTSAFNFNFRRYNQLLDADTHLLVSAWRGRTSLMG